MNTKKIYDNKNEYKDDKDINENKDDNLSK